MQAPLLATTPDVKSLADSLLADHAPSLSSTTTDTTMPVPTMSSTVLVLSARQRAVVRTLGSTPSVTSVFAAKIALASRQQEHLQVRVGG